MKTKNIILIFIILASINFKVNAQCAIDAGVDKTIICGDNVQLNAEPLLCEVYSCLGYVLQSVFFTDNLTGYAIGGGKILKTTDAGANWAIQTNADGKSVYFTDANTGYSVGYSGTIIKTIDGGTNWTVQTSGTTNNLMSVYFTDANTGYAVGYSGTIIKTIDGGTNWTTQTSGTTNDLMSVYFTVANTGCTVGYGGTILKTIDGGTNWTTQTSGIGVDLYSVYFTVANTGYAVGDMGTILKTINGGTNWTVQTNGTTNCLFSVYFPDANTGYFVGIYADYSSNSDIFKLSIPSSYSWSPANGLSASNIANPMARPTITTKYILSTNANGCIATDSVTVYINPLTINGTDASITCGDIATLNTNTNYTGTGTLTYSWLPVTGLNNASDANPLSSVTSNQAYCVSVTTSNGCIATDSVFVFLNPLNNPDICMVGIDSASNKNLIVWEKPVNEPIDSFFIYKESNVSGVYNKIGEVAYNNLSVFIDTNSNPQIKSSSYKISILDSCGIETSLSSLHKTMHLNINQGMGNTWNLIWNDYEGFTVSSYNIYRGTSPDTLSLINTTTAGNTSFSDLAAPSGYVYYQVEVVCPVVCDPSKSINSYNTSKSNIASNNPTWGIEQITKASDIFHIYPNPANDHITIDYGSNYSTMRGYTLKITNTLGQTVFTSPINQAQSVVDLSTLSGNGIYFVHLIDANSNTIDIRKIVLQ